MFKPLLRSMSSISGNFTLACKLNEYIKKENKEYVAYINDAILMPLDNNYQLTKNIQINLINSKYEYDVNRYFRELSSYFYDDTYIKNHNIFETYRTKELPETILKNIKENFENTIQYMSYLRDNGLQENFNALNNSKINNSEINLPDNRDKNFEFGCKRISYNKYQYQYQFYAPIYINKVEDLPDAFVIEIYNETSNNILKRIKIPIARKINLNKLRIYLTRFIEKIENNIPCVWQFDNNKIIYQRVIDCVNGGLIDFTSYNIINKTNIEQTLINDLDNLICRGYSDNNIIISEVIPLSFLFNIDDILSDVDKYYYHFNKFIIKGYYIKQDTKYLNTDIRYDFYDFSYNYHDDIFEYDEYDPLTNRLNTKTYNLFNNDVLYSLHEGTNYKLYYQNTFKKNYFKWKLFESDKYITNVSCVYSYNKNENKFPLFKNSIVNNIYASLENTNMIIPINRYTYKFNDSEIFNYKLFINNNYSHWFDLYNDDSVKNETIYSPVSNGYVYHNGVLYYINDKNIKNFSVFINPILNEYDPNMILGNNIFEYMYTNSIDGVNLNNYKYPDDTSVINSYYTVDNRDNIDLDEFVYYIDNQVNSLYTIYDESILQDFISKESSDTFFTSISSLSEWINICDDTFDLIFSPISGYQKLNIDTHNIDNDYFLKKIFVNNNLKSKIYYSLANRYDKRNLHADLSNDLIDIETLLSNKFTLFIKQNFLKIFNGNDFLNIIYHSSNVMSLYEKLNMIYEGYHDTDTYDLKQHIEMIPIILNDKTIYDDKELQEILSSNANKYNNYSLYNELMSIDSTDEDLIVSAFQKIISRLETDTTLNQNTSIIKIIKSIFAAYKIYKYINILDVDKYRYVYIDNKNNLNINSDYYELIDDICKLYIDYNIYNNLALSEVDNIKMINNYENNIYYVSVDTVDKLNYLYRHYYQNYNDLYIRENIIDNNLNIITRIYLFKEYVKKYLNEYLNDRCKEDNEENSNFVLTDEASNPLIKIEVENNFDFIKSYIQNINGKLYLHILFFTEYIDIPLNLYFKQNLVNIKAKELSKYNLDDLLLLIYKEDKNYDSIRYSDEYISSEIMNDNKLQHIHTKFVKLIYDDYTISQINKFKFNVLLKNLLIQDNDYIYCNPYNTLIRIKYSDFLKFNPNSDKQLYRTSKSINNYDVEFITNGDGYGYIKINYNIIKSSNNFMLKNIDDNDNIKISTVNNVELDEFTIGNMFRNIYPYIKQDILVEMISTIISNDELNIRIKCILPTSLSYKIKYKVKKRTNNVDFTDIHTQKYNIQNIYINRYFNNISPYLKMVDSYIYNERSKIYLINDDTVNNIANNNNVYVENLNIHHHNQIHEYSNKEIRQYEYKHFNDNKIYNLPPEIVFQHDDIKYFFISDLEKYKSKDACFYYFKKYINNSFSVFFNENNKIDDIEYLFLFNKYHINYLQNDVILFNEKYKKAYTITYKLNLI